MESKSSKFTLSLCLILGVLFSQTFTETIAGIAQKVSQTSNEVSNLGVTQEVTNTLTGLEGKALDAITDGEISDASRYVKFLLFTRISHDNYTIVKIGDKKTLLEDGFKVPLKTKILIHGWISNGTDSFDTEVRQAFLKKEKMNVISVDWSKMAMKPYTVAFTAAPHVGNHTAYFIDFLVKTVGVKLSSIHVIGWSLGAHVGGAVGEHVSCGKLPRLTGLDPAGPLYTSSQKKGRLDAADAKFVDVIHTTSGTVAYADQCGTVDFYPNGGYGPQPGCNALDALCSHERAYQFFAESVTSTTLFRAWRCDSWESFKEGACSNSTTADMGYPVSPGVKGVYYLETNSKKPFAKG